jgi:hypothetical protein
MFEFSLWHLVVLLIVIAAVSVFAIAWHLWGR